MNSEEEGVEVQGAAAGGAAGAAAGGAAGGGAPKSAGQRPVWVSLEEASQLKSEGNALYRERNIRSAIGRYHRALLVLRGLDSDVMTVLKGFGAKTPSLSPEQEEFLRNTQVDCYNNLAACLLQKASVDYSRVLEYSERVLRLRPANVKALYRAGVATLETGDAQRAKHYLSQACREQPNDSNVRKQLQRVEDKLNEELQKEKDMYRGMFSSGVKNISTEETNQTNRDDDGV